jgi:hypothetical protein
MEEAGIACRARLLSPSGLGLRNRIFALFAAYFDKSSDAARGITSVAGYVASLDEWQAVERRWNSAITYWSRLEGFRDLGGFHMSVLERSIGKENAELCVKYFSQILLQSRLQGIGAAILNDDWERSDWGDNKTIKLGSTYEQCLDLALDVLARHVNEAYPGKSIDVVCCRDARAHYIEQAFNRKAQQFSLFGTLTTGTGANITLLQCADLGAGTLRLKWREIAEGRIGTEDIPWGDLPSGHGMPAKTAFWSLRQGAVLARLLEIHGRKRRRP